MIYIVIKMSISEKIKGRKKLIDTE